MERPPAPSKRARTPWRLPSLVSLVLPLVTAVVLSLLHPNGALAAFTAASVTPASPDAGVSGTITVAFPASTTIPIGGSITVIFPAGFYVASTASVTAFTTGIDASSTLVATPATSQVTITIASSPSAAGDIQFDVDGISNPGEGTTAKYMIKTASASGLTLEYLTNIPGSVITKTTFTGGTLTVPNTNAGVSVSYTFSFTPSLDLRAGARVELQFPVLPASNYVLRSTDITVSNWVGLDPTSTALQVSASTIRLIVAGATVAAGSPVSVQFNNVLNPAAQVTGATFAIRSRDAYNNIYEEQTDVAGPTITSTTLSSAATLTPISYLAGNVTSYIVGFTNAAYLTTGAKIVVIFPSRYSFNSVSVAGASNVPTSNGVVSATASPPNTITFTLGSGPLAAGASRTITLSGIVNPGTSCDQFLLDYCTTTWESYTVRLTDSASNIYEESTTVPGTPIVKKVLSFGRVRPVLMVPNTITSATLTFNSEATIPVGGAIEIVFPSGYLVSTSPIPVASNHVGTPAASTSVRVSGLQVTLVVAGATNIPPTVGLSVQFSGITTPPGDTTGIYIVRTRDATADNAIIEESQSIAGEGCMYMNDCNGHGTCTLFTKTCICNDGWGAPRDIALYKSPDCTTRVCPTGFTWASIPTDEVTAHDTLEECSGMGTCDRVTGKCACFPGFLGGACERIGCPNICNGKGRCLSMREMAQVRDALPLSAPTMYTGASLTSTWDESRIFGCACDSTWAVGTGAGEIQATEYFGADCSMRHCPTGNDPDTDKDETNCAGVAAPGGLAVGATGNLCLVECSNRGICNYKTGSCTCFEGYTGFACQNKDVLRT